MSPSFEQIAAIVGPHLEEGAAVTPDMALIGEARALSSMALVEVCLELEDLADEQGFVFDWTSEHAMSRSRSIFRTLESLVAEFEAQKAGGAA